jgi:NAD-dependent dihydropyrimidine dehydrogenase PreA subunit
VRFGTSGGDRLPGEGALGRVGGAARLPPHRTWRLTPRWTRGAIERARDVWRLDAVSSTIPLRAQALRRRRVRIETLRHLFQAGLALLVVAIGAQFVRWVHALETVGKAGVARPPGVEGFLPIAALMSLRYLWTTGEVHPVHPAGLVILLAILCTGVFLKKAFCSWLCPIGALSEALAAVSLKLFRKRLRLPRLLDIPMRGLKYLLLLFFLHVIFVTMGSADIAAFLDSPYSRVADVKMLLFFTRPSPFTLEVLAALGVLSLVIPYFWCRYLCPYGALLGVVSLFSPLKVTRHAPSCIDCGLCARACPSQLRVDRLTRVRSDECSGCLSCVAACPVPRALRVETPAPWRAAIRPAVFAALVLLLFGGSILGARTWGPWRNRIDDREYAARLREIDDPRYQHLQGRVVSDDDPPVRPHDADHRAGHDRDR